MTRRHPPARPRQCARDPDYPWEKPRWGDGKAKGEEGAMTVMILRRRRCPRTTTTFTQQLAVSQLLIDFDYCAAFDSPIVSSQSFFSCKGRGCLGEVSRSPRSVAGV